MSQIKDMAGDNKKEDESETTKTEESNEDPNKQHFKYHLLNCEAKNSLFIGKMEGGVAEIQDSKRKIFSKCYLRIKGKVKESDEGKELRFESDDKVKNEEYLIGPKVDELVVMDECAFVL